jgi:hypothetical protein
MSDKDATVQSQYLDLNRPDQAYFYGFTQADGHLHRLTGQKGYLAIELNARDRPILENFTLMFPFYSAISERERDTNFKVDYHSVEWRAFDLGFRQELVRLGFPEGRKSEVVAPPSVNCSWQDYFRGLLDADGSLGMAYGGRFPFVSLTTSSDKIAHAYASYIERLTGQVKAINRNRRDKVFNITVFKESAQSIVRELYPDGCLALSRKREQARLVLSWVRPAGFRKVEGRRAWTASEDVTVLVETLQVASERLGRTLVSVTLRRRRLRKAQGITV